MVHSLPLACCLWGCVLMTYHVVIADNLDPVAVEVLQAGSAFRITNGPLSREQTAAALADADALVVRSATKVNAELLAAAPALKVVARAGAGVDNIDVAAATGRGVAVMNTPGGNTIAAAELTFALMLAMARHVPAAVQSLREGRWDRKAFTGTELRGKTLGIVGLGRIGQAVAVRAQAFEMETIAYDPYQPPEVFERLKTPAVALDDLLARSDYITLHAPAGEETRHLINADSIARMKDGVRIVNAARGTLIDPAALAAAIRAGKVAGAAVDVYSTEPPPADDPLIGLDGVVHTPHLGASTWEAQVTVGVQAAEQIRDALLKGEFRNVVNPDVLKKAPAGG
jgi:D-3-phosphoglycerate dehydrogenase